MRYTLKYKYPCQTIALIKDLMVEPQQGSHRESNFKFSEFSLISPENNYQMSGLWWPMKLERARQI
jgi:hypothetical protein